MQLVSKRSLSITDILSVLTKDELQDIRKGLNIKNVSSLNKKELVQVLSEYLPEHLEQQLGRLDQQRYHVLEKVLAHGGEVPFGDMIIDEDYEPSFFQSCGLLFIHEKSDVVIMPHEIREKLLKVDKKWLKPRLARNTEWNQLTKGLLFYYGVMEPGQLIDMISKYTNQSIEYLEYYQIIADYAAYDLSINVDRHGFSYYMVMEPFHIKQEHQARPMLDYYPFTKAQVLLAADDEFIDRHSGYRRFVMYLLKNWSMDAEEVDLITSDLVDRIQEGDPPNELLSSLQSVLDFKDMKQVQELLDIMMQLSNQTRLWILKGHSPDEVFAEEKKRLKPLPMKPLKNPSAEIYNFETKQKVGRNDPCPCGSGKKFKKCCGG